MSDALTPPTLHDAPRWRGLRVGLLGGSFNPPHAGHLHIARLAMAKFGLDFVWWIVTPQNPLKDRADMAPYTQRFERVTDMLAPHPRQMPTHLERDLGTTYTHETVSALKARYPHTHFLWICGMDNAQIFHRWDRWRDLTRELPVAFIARPPAGMIVQSCPLRLERGIPHHFEAYGRKTDLSSPGIYWIQGVKMVDISSTKIRNNNRL
jgi:nicotinate-nucleotide adenylyltransferase